MKLSARNQIKGTVIDVKKDCDGPPASRNPKANPAD